MSIGVSIIGSTGSIGRQALEVVASHPGLFRVVGLCARSNVDLLARQVREHEPTLVSVGSGYGDALRSLLGPGVTVLEGERGMRAVASLPEAGTVLVSTVGASAIIPLLSAIEEGKTIALANKECLVAAGSVIMPMLRENGNRLIPVDSEHSAIFQCLDGQDRNALWRITLTASGGPFRELNSHDLARVSPEDALNHPTWRMGRKISVDSATLMNKGFEVIEARWLFGMPPGGIRVVVHPQSIVHSMVEFRDGSTLAHLGPPDMRIPIRYALSYPARLQGREPIDLVSLGCLTFLEPDLERFPCLGLAYKALESGGTLPAVMNAADEVAVEAFLSGDIGFSDIQRIIGEVMEEHTILRDPGIEEIMEADAWARQRAHRLAELEGDGR